MAMGEKKERIKKFAKNVQNKDCLFCEIDVIYKISF